MPTLTLEAGSLSPLALVLQADIVVKAVMIGLILASIWVWTIIVVHGRKLAKVRREAEAFERDFWKASDIDRFHDSNGKAETPSARVLAAGLAEWRRSTARPVV
ncbi:MAG: MotA/TolQ/ExbB proton channel family protein, partial [Sphingomonas sp.]